MACNGLIVVMNVTIHVDCRLGLVPQNVKSGFSFSSASAAVPKVMYLSALLVSLALVVVSSGNVQTTRNNDQWRSGGSFKPLQLKEKGNFFMDVYSVQTGPKQMEFGHVFEDPNSWEQRYEKKDDENGRFQGKTSWGDKDGKYGEQYWDYNHGHDVAADTDGSINGQVRLKKEVKTTSNDKEYFSYPIPPEILEEEMKIYEREEEEGEESYPEGKYRSRDEGPKDEYETIMAKTSHKSPNMKKLIQQAEESLEKPYSQTRIRPKINQKYEEYFDYS